MAFFFSLLGFPVAESPPNFLSQDSSWGKPHWGARTVATETFGIAFPAILRYVFREETSYLHSGWPVPWRCHSSVPRVAQLVAPEIESTGSQIKQHAALQGGCRTGWGWRCWELLLLVTPNFRRDTHCSPGRNVCRPHSDACKKKNRNIRAFGARKLLR